MQIWNIESDKKYKIIRILLEQSDDNLDCKMTLYPMFAYKMILHYEEMSIFETMFQLEIEANSPDAARIISDWFNYSVGINKLSISAYLCCKYSCFLFKMQEVTANGFLQTFQEYFSTQNNIWKVIGIIGLEERLYLIELCLHYFNNEQAKLLVKFLK